jgi:hypothetical protein
MVPNMRGSQPDSGSRSQAFKKPLKPLKTFKNPFKKPTFGRGSRFTEKRVFGFGIRIPLGSSYVPIQINMKLLFSKKA